MWIWSRIFVHQFFMPVDLSLLKNLASFLCIWICTMGYVVTVCAKPLCIWNVSINFYGNLYEYHLVWNVDLVGYQSRMLDLCQYPFDISVSWTWICLSVYVWAFGPFLLSICKDLQKQSIESTVRDRVQIGVRLWKFFCSCQLSTSLWMRVVYGPFALCVLLLSFFKDRSLGLGCEDLVVALYPM
jgi:hypothetical protein